MKPEELRKLAEEDMAMHIDANIIYFKRPKEAYPHLVDGFQFGFRKAEQMFDHYKYVPGHFRCPKCNLALIAKAFSVTNGAVGPDTEPQKCANGCGPMRRVPWIDWMKDRAELSEMQHKEIQKLKAERDVTRERFGPAGYKIIEEVAALRERLKKYEST